MKCSFCNESFQLFPPVVAGIEEDRFVLEIDSYNCVYCHKGSCDECAELIWKNVEFDDCILGQNEVRPKASAHGLTISSFRRRLKICPECFAERGNVLPDRFGFDTPAKIKSMICQICLSDGILHFYYCLITCFSCGNLLCKHDSLVLLQGNSIAHFCNDCFKHFLEKSPVCPVCKNRIYPYQEKSYTDYRGFRLSFLAYIGEALLKTCHICKTMCCLGCCSLIKENCFFVKNTEGEYAYICHSCSEKKIVECNSRIMPYEEYERMIDIKRTEKEADEHKKLAEKVKVVRFANASEEEDWYREHKPGVVSRQHDEKGAWAYEDERNTVYENRSLLGTLKEYLNQFLGLFKR